MAGETQNAENCISSATQHVKDSEEFVQKLRVLCTFEKVNVQDQDATQISSLLLACQSFESSCSPTPDPFQISKRFIEQKLFDLGRRIQQAQQTQKPWLQTLMDTKTQLEQLSAKNLELQKKTQHMIQHARNVSQQCRQVQREAEEKRRWQEWEKQQKEIEEMLVIALHYTVALDHSFTECTDISKKYPYDTWSELSDEDKGNAVVECDKLYTHAHKLLAEAGQKVDSQMQHCLRTYAGPRSAFAEHQPDFTRLRQRIRSRERPLREMVLELRNMEEAMEEKVAFMIAEQMQKLMKEKELDEEGLFNSVAKDGLLKLEDFKGLFTVSEVLQKYAKNLFDLKVRPGREGVELPSFKLLKKILYRVKSTNPITEELGPEKLGASKRALEMGEVVEAIEPRKLIGSTWRLKVKCTIDDVEGYVNVRGMTASFAPMNFLMPFTQHFNLVRNAILTDIFDLVDFKSIRRLKKDEKLWALDIPKKEASLEVNRIQCAILDDAADVGFISLVGNQGSDFVEPVYAKSAEEPKKPEKEGEEEQPVQKISLEDWGKKCTDELNGVIATFKESATELQKFEIPDGEQTIEDLNKLRQEFEEKSRKTNEMNMKVQSMYDRHMHELKKFSSGILGEIKASIDKIQEDLVEFRTVTLNFIPTFREKMSTAITHRRQKDDEIAREKAAEERRKVIEEKKAKAAEFAKEARDLVTPLEEKITELKTSSQKLIVESPLAELAVNAEETEKQLVVVNEMLESISTGVSEIHKKLGDVAQYCEKDMAEVAQQLADSRCVTTEARSNLKAADASKKIRAVVEFAQNIKKHLIAKDQKCDALFATIADGKDKVDVAEFLEGIKKEVSDIALADEFQKVAVSDYSHINLRDCKAICNVYYLNGTKTDMTEEVASDSSVVRSVVEKELLEYLDGPSKEGEITRVKCRALNDYASGWVSMKNLTITSNDEDSMAVEAETKKEDEPMKQAGDAKKEDEPMGSAETKKEEKKEEGEKVAEKKEEAEKVAEKKEEAEKAEEKKDEKKDVVMEEAK